MDITNIGIITAIVLGLTQADKMAGEKSKFAPFVAIVVGVGVALLFAPVSKEVIVTGLVSALSAMGLWSGTSATFRD